MSHLWVENNQEWCVLPLAENRVALTADPARPVTGALGVNPARGLLLPPAAPGSDWILLCRPGACSVNGRPVALGIRALADRDEIVTAPGTRLFFSSESLAAVVPFEAVRETFCPRCLLAIAHGAPAVRCPQCGIAYHEDTAAALACWSYGPCVNCGHSSEPDAGFRWTPDELPPG
ncbi:MAG TPA: hypothetical protein VKT77_11555 [Chthonomonadaceae bacterium]|nr:hypothetical protein [Chthonomonadaceae bacterium]